MVEQRRSKRYELRLPVELIRAGAASVNESGETKNLSSSGILMTTEARFDVGESVEYLITLPVRALGEQALRLRCVGKMVRHEATAAAATLDRYEFLRD